MDFYLLRTTFLKKLNEEIEQTKLISSSLNIKTLEDHRYHIGIAQGIAIAREKFEETLRKDFKIDINL